MFSIKSLCNAIDNNSIVRIVNIKVLFILILFSLFPLGKKVQAEGSKDFRSYVGTRMWLDTRDEQQLKVYAEAGEFINVGASHVGLAGGFIQVYKPDGTLFVTYDGTGTNPNKRIRCVSCFDSTIYSSWILRST